MTRAKLNCISFISNNLFMGSVLWARGSNRWDMVHCVQKNCVCGIRQLEWILCCLRFLKKDFLKF